jgi:hypothetical protein
MLDACPNEYLVNHGKSGAFGRFAPVERLTCQRGEAVVIRSPRGLELGVVLCAATPRHARFLGQAVEGELLRRATPEDRATAARMGTLGQRLFEDGRRLAAELGLAFEVLDVEVFLDGRQAIVQHLSPEHCDPTPVVQALAHGHNLTILLENLATPVDAGPAPEEETHGGCGEPGCGRASGSGCTSCGTGGGCSSCGSGKVDMGAYFAHLRSKMEERQRVPLL